MINPVLQALTVLAVVLFFMILIAMICTCYKYKNLKVRYSKLAETDGTGEGAGEIELQTRS
jgi:hypothetical protein